MSKRKKYSGPKYICKNVMTTFFGSMSGVHGEHLQTTQCINAAAMQAIVQGRGDKDSWDRLVGAMNIAIVMVEQGIGREYRQELIAAREALLACGVRSVETGRFVFTGDELKVMNESLLIHDAQLENTRAIDIDKAAAEVIRRLNHHIDNVSVTKTIQMQNINKMAA